MLAEGDHDLAGRFFRAAAAVIDDPWTITKLFDSAMPHVDAEKRRRTALLGALARLVMAVGAQDAAVAGQIARIAGLLDRPAAALRPAVLLRAAWTLGSLGVESLPTLGRVASASPAPCPGNAPGELSEARKAASD
ncbi:hypothetical protein [Nocardia sp. CY41]|uniref:hypothetical protein n=1 Tax=Nocardia sp. CY41 TaxID=2608686 RepID=UPI00135BC0FD|nr:hypothetical protein [Nocardia sp. CY41]